MSGLEQRCLQFHEAALGTGKSKGDMKEIATLRRFLHKNQQQRFTDKATSRLFDTIQIYIAKRQLEDDENFSEAQESLLDDALKMPFTVFTTKQKKTMMKWLGEIRGDHSTTNDSPATAKTEILSVIDITDNEMTLMNDETGDTHDNVALPKTELGESVARSFHETESTVQVRVEVGTDSNVTLVELVSQ